MVIQRKRITIKELVKDYVDNAEEGVKGYGGRLDIRPPYQREFIYNDKQQRAVIDTIMKNFPLNVMYWAVNNDGDNKTYEIIDGQQRTISICRYVTGLFSFNNLYFHNLSDTQKKQILDYSLHIYVCEGTESKKLDWFKTINIAGEKLTDQELRNAVYHGSWVTDAKRYFSKTGCPAYQIGSDYIKGTPIRQDYLETVLKWISEDDIEQYMGRKQHNENALDLWDYFREVIDWIESVFPVYRKEMSGLPWGELYNQYKNIEYDAEKIEERIKELMNDEDVTKKKGIYLYIITGEEKHLSIRLFDQRDKKTVYDKQEGKCAHCGKSFDFNQMHADHVMPWSKGGKTVIDNCQILCQDCNARKSSIY